MSADPTPGIQFLVRHVGEGWIARQDLHAQLHHHQGDNPFCWCCCAECHELYQEAGLPTALDLLGPPT